MEGGQSVCRQPGTSPSPHDAYRPKRGVGRRPVSGGDPVAPTHHGNGGNAASENHRELPPGDLQPEQGLLLRDLAYWCACFARRFFARHSRSIRWQPYPRIDHRPAPLGNPCGSRVPTLTPVGRSARDTRDLPQAPGGSWIKPQAGAGSAGSRWRAARKPSRRSPPCRCRCQHRRSSHGRNSRHSYRLWYHSHWCPRRCEHRSTSRTPRRPTFGRAWPIRSLRTCPRNV